MSNQSTRNILFKNNTTGACLLKKLTLPLKRHSDRRMSSRRSYLVNIAKKVISIAKLSPSHLLLIDHHQEHPIIIYH